MKAAFFSLYPIVFLVFVCLNSQAQNYSLQITSELKEDKSVDFLFEKNNFGSFFLNLTFNQLENAPPASFKGTLVSTKGKLLNIRPINPDRPIGFSYSYTFIRGQLNPKFDAGFVYLLPVSKGKSVKVQHHINLNARYFGSVEPKNWISFQFNVDAGDTVFSARKGLVVEIKDSFDPDPSASVSFSSKSNFILIEHDDGTLARYDVLKKGSRMVMPGQIVYPHTPLALAGTYDEESNTQIRFLVYYLIEENLEKPEKSGLASRKNFYAFINPVFHTGRGDSCLRAQQNYTADYKDEHITIELGKREKKKLITQKLSAKP